MKTPHHQTEREEQARIEAGHTAVRPAAALLMTAAFLVLIASVPLVQYASDLARFSRGERAHPWPQFVEFFRRASPALGPLLRGDEPLVSRVIQANRSLLREMVAFENALDDELAMANLARPHAQFILSRMLGAGNDRTYCGRDGWLFYGADVDHAIGPGFLDPSQQARRIAGSDEWAAPAQPDPVKAILRFNDQLADRGIKLVVMPTPVKPSVHPEKLSRACDPPAPLQNASYADFVSRLEKEGVLVFDCAAALRDAALGAGPQFLKTDTHWRPEAVELVAGLLARFIRESAPLPETAPAQYERRAAMMRQTGDIAAMLKLPAYQEFYVTEQVEISRVVAASGADWTPDASADVLVLGDSFSNIYSQEALGWGGSAGLIEQLSFELQRPVDRLVRNDDGAFATRAMLARELARGRDRLAEKRLVIWQFAARELSQGDWKLVSLELGSPAPSPFVVPAPGVALAARGLLASVSPAPRPGSVPYKDHIICAHIVDIQCPAGGITNGQAVVYMWSMTNNVRARAAGLRAGDVVNLTLKPWMEVAAEYEGINRSEPDDENLLLQEPCWGEPL